MTSLKERVRLAEAQMRLDLEKARVDFKHPGNKGTEVEESFRSFLFEYLPRRFSVGQGEIIDSLGSHSGQVDVVVAGEDHPFTFRSGSPGLFLVEGVTAAAEIKSVLKSNHFESALSNCFRFRGLKVERSRGTVGMGSRWTLERYHEYPPWFLFAYESDMELTTVKERLIAFDAGNPCPAGRSIDAVFLLDKGWVINFGDGDGEFRFITEDGKSVPGIVSQASDAVLWSLLGWLSASIPRVIRVDPVISHYLYQ